MWLYFKSKQEVLDENEKKIHNSLMTGLTLLLGFNFAVRLLQSWTENLADIAVVELCGPHDFPAVEDPCSQGAQPS